MASNRWRGVWVLVCLLTALALAGCGEDITNVIAAAGAGTPTVGDTDGDGLSDSDEFNIYGTSPMMFDTDGDGLSDYQEIVELGFDPTGNNLQFNPLISDVPQVGVVITTTPTLAVLAETSTGTEVSYGVERTSSFSQSQTRGSSSTNSTAVEIGQSLSASLGVSGGDFLGAVTYEYSEATTEETSFTWSDEQSSENTAAYSNAQTESDINGETLSGGVIAVAVDIVNAGNVSFTVNNVVLGAVMLNPISGQVLFPVGNLDFDTSFASFQRFSLGPGQRSSNLTFINGRLDLGTIRDLLRNSTGLNVQVAAYEITDDQGRAFAHNLTAIGAKTAKVLIDYAGRFGRKQERYLVATKAEPAVLRVTAGDVLERTLRVPFVTDPLTGALSQVRNVADAPEIEGKWLALYQTSDGVDYETVVYDPADGPYEFRAISLKANDVLHLIFVHDEDGDGLGTRQEFAFGSNPIVPDSDEDGVFDAEEIAWGLQPARPDSDFDGRPDGLTVVDAFAGSQYNLFLATREGKHLARGNNSCGEYGNNTDTAPSETTVEVVGAWKSIAAFSGVTGVVIAVGNDGQLYSWGCNPQGLRGAGSEVASLQHNTPQQVGTDDDWAAVFMGSQSPYAYALKTDGSLYAWGLNSSGQLGVGFVSSNGCTCVTAPTPVPGGPWLSVAAGSEHAVAIATDGSLWGWGNNGFGALGLPKGSLPEFAGCCSFSPIPLALTGAFTKVAASGSRTWALRSDGALWTFGENRTGLLGLGFVSPEVPPTLGGEYAPAQIPGQWHDVSAGSAHTLAIATDRTLWGWGSKDFAMLGLGVVGFNPGVELSPKQISAETNWVRVWANPVNSVALRHSPFAYWGWGFNGALALLPSAADQLCSITPCVPFPTQIHPRW